MSEKKKLKIKIFDKEYSLLVDNEDLAKDLAKYVDQIMEETRQELPNQPMQTVAVIAALNIAYDLFIEREKSKEFTSKASDKIKGLKLLLESRSLHSPS
ncbi:MAG: cell division protein ZapA [Ignavibacteria bacterium]|nr:cell division protein ZapA [Ignavibacteria bacterium]MCA0388328.1 cell division protein ZapA [Bacteroidota bacterium]